MTTCLYPGAIYLLFFLSGAAALVYQVVWVRSLTLVFGGSHQAVTAVLVAFMAGLALGGWSIGRVVDRVRRPLALYGWLELGIAAFALLFLGAMRIYPAVYVTLARGRDDSVAYLFVVRALFSVLALIVPTTLMGGTLPVLSRFVSRQPETLRSSLALLYGLNALGAVLGAPLWANDGETPFPPGITVEGGERCPGHGDPEEVEELTAAASRRQGGHV